MKIQKFHVRGVSGPGAQLKNHYFSIFKNKKIIFEIISNPKDHQIPKKISRAWKARAPTSGDETTRTTPHTIPMTRRPYSRIGLRVIRGPGELVGHQKVYDKY